MYICSRQLNYRSIMARWMEAQQKWLKVEKESAWELESLTKSRAHGCLNRSGLAATVAATWQYMCKKHALSLVPEKVMSSYRPRLESDFCGGCSSASEFCAKVTIDCSNVVRCQTSMRPTK